MFSRINGMRRFSLVLAVVLSVAAPAFAASNVSGCALKGRMLYGKVEVVKSFADFKVQVVNSFPDLKVMRVNSFPDACGKWQFVTSFPDFTIMYVESFPDLKIQMVESFPGEP
jgi:hypothetical protein